MENGASSAMEMPPIAVVGPQKPELSAAPTPEPKNRWESIFVWQFIIRFTTLRGRIEGLDTIADLETALEAPGQNNITHAILAEFIGQLRPKRNTSVKQISSTLYTLIGELCADNERSVWWNANSRMNILPFDADLDFFTLGWEAKLIIFRQLVDWQLTHNREIRETLDRANGVVRGGHRKRADDAPRQPLDPPDAQHTKEKLQYIPIGQDSDRKRYWAVDESHRIYLSGNPWKTTCQFQCVSKDRSEYLTVLEGLKNSRPPRRPTGRRGVLGRTHDRLISSLEEHLPKVDAEILRLAQVQKKLREKAKAKEQLAALTDLRDTRTRIKVSKVDYVYDPGSDREDGIIYDDGQEIDELDDDAYEEEPAALEVMDVDGSRRNAPEDEDYLQDDDDPEIGSSRARKGKTAAKGRSDGSIGSRRSGRPANKRSLNDEPAPSRGERRSARRSTLTSAANPPTDGEESDYRPSKRSRMSSVGSSLADSSASVPDKVSAGVASMSINGANGTNSISRTFSALRPGEKVQELPGKRKSKFWFYAVETVPDQHSVGDTNGSQLPKDVAVEGSFAADVSEDAAPSTERIDSPIGAANGHANNHSTVSNTSDVIGDSTPTRGGQAPPRSNSPHTGSHDQPMAPLPSPMILAE